MTEELKEKITTAQTLFNTLDRLYRSGVPADERDSLGMRRKKALHNYKLLRENLRKYNKQ